MWKVVLAFSVFFICLRIILASEQTSYEQERAKIIYVNEKYISNLTVLTRRRGRGSPYLTTVKGILLYSWGNNVSMEFEYLNDNMHHDSIFVIKFKTCDFLKIKWMSDFVKTYSNVPIVCPILPVSYAFIDVELPPRNSPVPKSIFDYRFVFKVYLTKTKERMLEISLNLKPQKKRKHNGTI